MEKNLKVSSTGFSDSVKISTLWLRTFGFTSFALAAFAANSVICRMALGKGAIDAAGFTAIRLFSGAFILLPLAVFTGNSKKKRKFPGNWTSAAMLFFYAVAFSFAYIGLTAGTGALILFGAVQVTMLVAGIRSGERPGRLQWAGLLVAVSGLIYLVLPGWQAPPLWAAALMATAGAAWGIYSLRGRGAANPIAVTGDNFLRTLPMVSLVGLAAISSVDISTRGALLAVTSGAITSGLGYVLWYAALRDLTATRAATVQLLVPVLAAVGGVAFLSEQITLRLVVSSLLIIGGVGSTLMGHPEPRFTKNGPAEPDKKGKHEEPSVLNECLGSEPCSM
jgi:drug/metabolite transporter (DMT)-like permease